MKKFLTLFLSVALFAACSACGQAGAVTQLPNPIKEVGGSADFAPLDLYIEAPDGAADVRYSIISDEIAQIQFALDGRAYTYRAALPADGADISGVYETFDEQALGTDVDYADGGVSIRVRTVKAGADGALADWTQDGRTYTLYTPDGVTADAINALAVKLAPQSLKQTLDAPAPDGGAGEEKVDGQPSEGPWKCGRADITVLENGLPATTRAITDPAELAMVDAISFDYLVKSMAMQSVEVSELESCVRLSFDWEDGTPGETYYAFDADGRHVLQSGETGPYSVMGDDAYNMLMQLLTGAETLRSAADRAVQAMRDGDFATLSAMIHPALGLTFTPYSTVNAETDRTVAPEAMAAFLSDAETYTWGIYDGSGEPIVMTNADYWTRFVWDADYAAAPNVTENEIRMTGTAYDNALESYPRAALVDYHYDGIDPQYEGIDWRSLTLVLLPENGVWYLVGVIHGEMTM